MSNQKSKAALYREMMQSRTRKIETVDLTADSGMVFTFEKPNKFAILFIEGNLPQTVASMASESWAKDGVGTGTKPEGLSENQSKLINTAYDMRDRFLAASVDPKLVMGKAENENELSVQDILPDDLTFLWTWFQSGGVESNTLNTFPKSVGQGSMAISNSKTVRKITKRNGRNNR